jgi:hypothetical protein
MANPSVLVIVAKSRLEIDVNIIDAEQLDMAMDQGNVLAVICLDPDENPGDKMLAELMISNTAGTFEGRDFQQTIQFVLQEAFAAGIENAKLKMQRALQE